MRRKAIIFFIVFFFYQVSIMGIGVLNHFQSNNSVYFFFIVAYVIMILAIFLFVYSLIKDIVKNATTEAKLHSLEAQNALREQQQEQLIAHKEKAVEFRQLMNHHLQKLKYFIQDQEYDTAQEYLKQVFAEFDQLRFHPTCNDSLINAILDNKKQVALKHDISVSYQILLPSDLHSSSPALSCIFFNLMDNGIEACIRSQDAHPFLSLETKVLDDYLSIQMRNSKNVQETTDGGTSKGDAWLHGYGISIIQDILTDCDGSYEWVDQGDWFESTLLVPYTKVELLTA